VHSQASQPLQPFRASVQEFSKFLISSLLSPHTLRISISPCLASSVSFLSLGWSEVVALSGTHTHTHTHTHAGTCTYTHTPSHTHTHTHTHI
jgi:hypothetical protein